MGGDIVPAMVCVAVRVVIVGSISVEVLWAGLWRVGVVIVVRRLFSRRKLVNSSLGRRLKRLMLRSPWMVISVLGWALRILSIASWKLCCIVRLLCGFFSGCLGLLYRLMMVWMGLVFWLVAWICKMHVATCGIEMFLMNVTCKLGL